MQIFGRFDTKFDDEFLVEHYIYINEDNEKITTKDLELKLKKKRKHVAGTIFLFNPCMSPVGYNTNSSLASQGYEFNGDFEELNFDDMSNLLYQATKREYKGKLIEIKYLFNINLANIETTSILDKFAVDLDLYNSDQLTLFEKTMNYQDAANIRLTGKFVFMGVGHKYDPQHIGIKNYARDIAIKAKELGKEVVFLHDRNYNADECIEQSYFLHPLAQGKAKDTRAYAFKGSFMSNPPIIKRIE
ncbi:hypothetical protein FJR48_05365 [Sulfurimonas lithotrophica]|uniref:Uncharacterized protein n=1 Tax=Sulfurimonas lithotrophica TaxID=2590022 RepID=A0A5P8P0I3_9BACT|nr:hypothetical protein [Sulfurimonas lithotrophica]QFR49184.1 hypothetical protein FJR48_05365 [Sulfurimonas lithotrophica]